MFGFSLVRKDLKRLLLYVDLAVVGIFLLSLALLVRDSYVAGFYEGAGGGDLSTRALWAMARDTAFVVGGAAWIFFRFFKDRITELEAPWAV